MRLSLLAALFLAIALRGAHADESASVSELTPGAEVAIKRGLDRLVELQVDKIGNIGSSYKVASTSLAGLAFLSAGDTYNRGKLAPAIIDCVHYLMSDSVKQEKRPGRVFFNDGEATGRMHAHGLAVLFLAECYGQTTEGEDALIRTALKAAVATSLDAQTNLGGWGYKLRGEPEWGTDEASVTITQIQALRAARNAGIYVPAESIASAIGYVKKSMTSSGACRYSLTMGGPDERARVSYELTAAAVATLNASGVYLGSSLEPSDELERGLKYLRTKIEEVDNPAKAAREFYWYGNFYAAQAFYQSSPTDWAAWFPRVRQEMLATQNPKTGGWSSARNLGEAYATASALLILQLPRRYLPILQR